LELKHSIAVPAALITNPINRTILELKQRCSFSIQKLNSHYQSYHFGIETTFNITIEITTKSYQSYHFGIETLLDDSGNELSEELSIVPFWN